MAIHTRKGFLRWILFTTLVAGSLDILSAFVDFYMSTGKGPEGVLRYIASAVFGKTMARQEMEMVWYSLTLHYLIAFLFTSFYFWLYPRIPFLSRYSLLSGVLYGIFVWLVMNLVVVPLSQAPTPNFTFYKIIKSSLILIFMIGIPISMMTSHYYRRNY